MINNSNRELSDPPSNLDNFEDNIIIIKLSKTQIILYKKKNKKGKLLVK